MKKKGSRIRRWFLGKTVSGMPVKFRFTYSWDLDKQVFLKDFLGNAPVPVSLAIFEGVVNPTYDGQRRFVLA